MIGNNKKTRYNPISRKNLRQYNQPKSKQLQQRALSDLAERMDFDKEMLETIIPVTKIFNSDEVARFWNYFNLYLEEFSTEDTLTISDFDDIAKLCKNSILEHRLLESKKKSFEVADIMNALDKINKENQILKKQLAATRDQRYDPRAGGNVTILDILAAYDRQGGEQSFDDRIRELEEEEKKEVPEGSYRTTVAELIT